MTPDGKYLADMGSAGFKEAEGLTREGWYMSRETGKETPAVVGGAYTVSSHASDGSVVTNAVFVWTGDSGSQFMSGWKLYPAGSVQTGADASISSSPANQATSAPSADEGGIIAGGQAMSVQAAQSHSPQGAGGGPSMGAMRSGLEGASWIPGPIGSVAAATLVGIDIYQGNYGQAALGALGIFGGRAMTSGVRAVRDTKIVTAALEGLSGAGAKLGNAFAGWAKGAIGNAGAKIRGGPSFAGLKDHASRHSNLRPNAYYNAAVQHLRSGSRFNFQHGGHNKTATVTRTGVNSFTFTSASTSGNRIFTHIEGVSEGYLKNLGITLPEGF